MFNVYKVQKGTKMVASSRSGFSLFEILVVIGIIGALVAVLLPTIRTIWKRVNITSVKTELRTLKSGIDQFKLDTGQYPNSLDELVERPSDPKTAKKWLGGYYGKDEIPVDPWHNEYQYEKTPGKEHPYELYSEGPGGQVGPISAWE